MKNTRAKRGLKKEKCRFVFCMSDFVLQCVAYFPHYFSWSHKSIYVYTGVIVGICMHVTMFVYMYMCVCMDIHNNFPQHMNMDVLYPHTEYARNPWSTLKYIYIYIYRMGGWVVGCVHRCLCMYSVRVF